MGLGGNAVALDHPTLEPALDPPDLPPDSGRIRKPRLTQASLFAKSEDPVLQELRGIDLRTRTAEEVVALVRRTLESWGVLAPGSPRSAVLALDEPEYEDCVVWFDYDYTIAGTNAILVLMGLVGTGASAEHAQ